jgi:tetratricopeptide (TPR) repeat protein
MKRSRIDLAATLCLCILITETVAARAASLRQIQRLYKRKQYNEARRLLDEELPGLKGRSRNKGLLLRAALETEIGRAVDVYRQIISAEDSPEALEARLALAKIYYTMGEYRNAVTVLSRIPGRGPTEDRMAALYFRALCWKQLGESESARSDLKAIDRGSFLYWSYATLAELDMQEGRIGDAVEKYEAIAGSHSNPVAGFKLGECYEILGERDKALEVYRTLLQQFPEALEAPKAREKIQMIQRHRRPGRDEPAASGRDEEQEDEEPSPPSTATAGYTLQFGAFSERENAIRLADELRRIVPDIRLERIERDGRTWFRVRTGRFASIREAEEAAGRLQEKTGYFSKPLPLE